MALKTAQATVTTAAAAVPTPAGSGVSLALKNTGTNTIYIGDASVSTTTGWPLAAGEGVALQTGGGETAAVWAVVASGTSTLALLAAGA